MPGFGVDTGQLGGGEGRQAVVAGSLGGYRAAEHDLHAAEGRERRARTRLTHAEEDMRRARRDGQTAAHTAESCGTSLQLALGMLPAGALGMAGAPAVGQLAAEAGIPRPQVREVPLGEREPPKSWPGPLKALFRVGRGEATAISGLWNLGRSAVDHRTQVPGALLHAGEHAVEHPLDTGKALIGYDELAKGRYEDWLGQLGIGALTAAAGGSAARLARLRRIAGSAKLYQLGARMPRWGQAFAGRRVDFSKPDLGARPGSRVTVPAERARLAREYPRGVRFTRAGHPVLTPYAVKRVHVDGLNGDMPHDNPLANAKAGIPGSRPPQGYSWHHVEDGKTMELVPRDLHYAVKHTGGRAAIPGQLKEVTPGGAFTWGERSTGALGALGGGAAGGPAESSGTR